MKKTHILFILCAGLQLLGGQQAQGIENDGAVDNFLDSILTTHQHSAPTAPPTRAQAASYDETAGMNASQVRELGVDYAEARHGKAKNEQKAIELYRKAADMGDMKAQRWMGWRYRQGRGVQQNERLACTYFNMAAEQGDTAAADALGQSSTNNDSQTGILNNQQARMWAERIWKNYSNNDISYMWNWYESTVHLPKKGTYMSLSDLMDSQRKYLINRWTYRTCQPLDFAWAGNRVEIRFRYTCDNNTGKSVSGYCKNTLFISPNGRIQGFMDDSSTKTVPAFSPGLQQGH